MIKRVYSCKEADKCDELLTKLISDEVGGVCALVDKFYRWGLRDSDKILLCSIENNMIVGYVYAKPQDSHFTGKSYLIDALYVEQKFRGRGLGKELMQECIKEIHEMGVSQIDVNVVSDNDIAKSLYSGLGFETYRETMHLSVE